MNPFYWLIQRELYLIHEFIADEKAVADKDAGAFASMLLHAQYGKLIFSPAHLFFYSPVKRRLLMLITSTEPRFSYVRRIIATPLVACIVLLSAFKLQKADDPVLIKNNNETNSVQPGSNNFESTTATVFQAGINDSVLYVIDRKIVKASEVESELLNLEPDKIYSIRVLKGDDAIKKYGDKGKNGVIEIYTKNVARSLRKTTSKKITTTRDTVLLKKP